MPEDIESLPLAEDECTTPAVFRDALRNQEKHLRREIVGCGLLVGSTAANMVNVFDAKLNIRSKDLTPLEVDPVPNDGQREANLANLLLNRTAIEYAEIGIGGTPTWLLISRPGRSLIYKGKMSTFGGPADTGMREDEGLAIVGTDNFAAITEKHRDLFGTELFGANQTAGSTPLGRRLNPEAFYIACRWNYKVEVAREDLVSCSIRVRNAVTGVEHEAIATDWGPHQRTGRVADISPGLAKALGLRTDDECIVTVTGAAIKPQVASGLPGTLTPTDAPGNLKVYSQSEIETKFGKLEPPAVTEKGDGSFTINNPNFMANIVVADLSPLIGVPGVPANGQVRCHTLIRADLEAAAQEIGGNAQLKALILTWDGLFVPRHILWNPSRNFSTHSWGIAFDINVRWNGYGARPAPFGTHGSVADLVPIFAKHGFTWGGYWKTPDGMHFQYGR